jgi:hypothetical protein
MADTNKFVQTQKTTLYGSGVASTDTSIILSSLKLPDGSTTITMTDFGSIGFATIEPGTSREEQISFTGITQNVNGTATLTGVTRGLRFVAPYDSVTANKKQHAGGSILVVTNTAGFYDKLLAKGNDETITGKYTFSTIPESSDSPLSDNDLATKKYVDDNVNGGTVSINRIIVSGTAGEDVSADTLVYLKASDSRWWKVDADLSATLDQVILGITQGSGTTGNAIAGGILTNGIHTTTGLTANSTYYASNTAGAIATSAGTNVKIIGLAISTTQLHFDPTFFDKLFVSTSAGAGDSGKVPLLNSTGLLDQSFTKSPIVRTYSNSGSPHTWTRPTGLKYVIVEVQAGGGAGGGSNNASDHKDGCGGGAGGYTKKLIAVASLGATETITVGTGGTGVANGTGNTGGTSSFGSHCSANGGTGGSLTEAGSGGTSTGGDVNIRGGGGGAKVSIAGTDDECSGTGGNAFLGYGGKGSRSAGTGEAGGNYGGGGGGAVGSGLNAGGAGGEGIVIVTEYYN